MSLSRCVVRQLGRPRPLAASSHRSALPTAVRKFWGASFGRQWSSSVAEDRKHGTDGVPLKSVEDLPTLGNTWSILWRWFVPKGMTIMSKRYRPVYHLTESSTVSPFPSLVAISLQAALRSMSVLCSRAKEQFPVVRGLSNSWNL